MLAAQRSQQHEHALVRTQSAEQAYLLAQRAALTITASRTPPLTAKPEAVGYLAFLRSMTAKAIFGQYGFTFLIQPTS